VRKVISAEKALPHWLHAWWLVSNCAQWCSVAWRAIAYWPHA